MILIKPSFKIEAINGEDLGLLERAGRTCYKSEPKGDPEGFISSKIKSDHTTIIEHISHGFKISCFNETRYQYYLKQIMEIASVTVGMQWSWAENYFYISINPRTLREAKLILNNGLSNQMLALLKKDFNCLYNDLISIFPLVYEGGVYLLTSEQKLNLPIPDMDKHNYMTVRFIADRGFTHELVRHRMAVYSQESTRWCNYSGGVTFIIPPWVNIGEGDWSQAEIDEICKEEDLFSQTNDYAWLMAMHDSEKKYIYLLKNGWSPQQARSVLPNSLKTEIVMTANFREWRLVLKQRALGTTGKPHPQMSELMIPLLAEVKTKVSVFDDLIVKE